MMGWTTDHIPSLSDRIAVVTGANNGLGFEAVKALAGRGAEVILAVRDPARGEAAVSRIRAIQPDARLRVSSLDLASLASIAAFARREVDELARLDILLNNAGLGLQNKRTTTADGFERQFGTNHLGHFALTGRLIPALLRAPAPRVVTIASIAHKRGAIHFDDLQSEQGYSGRNVYGQSKLANLIFALELDRRARAAGSVLMSVAAHPGVSSTGFIAATGMPGLMSQVTSLAIGIVGQSAARGALSGLYAATMPDVTGGQYWGPDGLMEIRGEPSLVEPAPQALDRATWTRLWTVSEKLTGVTFPALSQLS